MASAHNAIKVAANRTGLTSHVIRVWEKRYGAVTPERTGTKRRLYSDEQIERLGLLRDITKAGHSIGHVAKLPTDKLRQLAREAREIPAAAPPSTRAATAPEALLEECVAAVKALDARSLDETLKRGAAQLGAQGLLQRVIAPLAQMIGDLWREGSLTAAHEHFATAVIRVFLGQAARPFAGTDQSPVLVVATPSGQLHELGALLAGAAAANLGWHVTYLGPSLPAAEIIGAARQNRARAVALSLVYPEDDPKLVAELAAIRQSLPPEVPLLVGGRAMPAYRDGLKGIGVVLVEDLVQFGSALDGLRRPAPGKTS
jgi:DNA-binding transcriptional MerR regulator/methylmalonyl-CoA mutase cobalamin-binding subunit